MLFINCFLVPYLVTWVTLVLSTVLAGAADDNAVNLYKQGNQFSREGRHEEAISVYGKAVEIDSSLHYAYTNWAHLLLGQGQADEAASLFLKAHQVAGTSKSACNLATALHHAGRHTQAQQQYEEAILLDSKNTKALYNLGTLLLERGALQEASAWFDQLLSLEPTHPEGRLNHCNILFALHGASADAEQCYDNVLAEHPRYVRALVNRASVLWTRGLEASAESEGSSSTHPLLLEATALFQQALELEPGNSLAQFGLQALRSSPDDPSTSLPSSTVVSPPEMPADYVRQLFDSYAGQFDASLQALGYATPSALASELASALEAWSGADHGLSSSSSLGDLKVLDLGCGTGLACSPLRSALQRFVRGGVGGIGVRVDGVDLSGGMLRVAEERAAAASGGGCRYDSLTQADALQYLLGAARSGVRYHVVLAADVLVYFGDLSALFEAVKEAVLDPGFFAFSVELLQPPVLVQSSQATVGITGVVGDGNAVASTSDDKGNTGDAVAECKGGDYVLHRSGRFAHSLCYIQKTAMRAGLSVVTVRQQTLRMDRGRDVPGLLFVLQLSA